MPFAHARGLIHLRCGKHVDTSCGPWRGYGERISTSTLPRTAPRSAVRAPGARWQAARWLALAAWVAMAVTLVLFGRYETSWDHLETAVANHEVTSVTIDGFRGSTAGSPGFAERVVWREGPLTRTTDVLDGAGVSSTDSHTHVALGTTVAAELKAANPDLRIDYGTMSGSRSMLSGFSLDGAWATLVFLPVLLTLAVAAWGPEPRGATSWGWFWLLFSPVSPVSLLAAPVYLLWGARGYRGGWRLTGGWAFVLAYFVLANLDLP